MDGYSNQWSYINMTQPQETGIDGLNVFSSISAQIKILERKMDAFEAKRTQNRVITYDYCADNHPSHQCTVNFEPVHYGGDFPNGYAYTDYHQAWGYHPDFSWSYNYEDQYYAPNPTYTPEFSCPPTMSAQLETLSKRLDIGLDKVLKLHEDFNMRKEALSKQIKNLMELIINTSTNGPQCMDFETDGEPELNLQLDALQDVDIAETSGAMENEAIEDLSVSVNEDEPIVLVPQVPSPAKFKNPVSFAKPCPIGSHVVGKAPFDMRANINLEQWWTEEKKKEEEPVVLVKPQCPNLIMDTTEEKAPSLSTFTIGHLSKKIKLGDFDTMTPTKAKPSHVTSLPMDEAGGESFFVPIIEIKFGGRQSSMHAMQIKERTARRHATVIFAIEPD